MTGLSMLVAQSGHPMQAMGCFVWGAKEDRDDENKKSQHNWLFCLGLALSSEPLGLRSRVCLAWQAGMIIDIGFSASTDDVKHGCLITGIDQGNRLKGAAAVNTALQYLGAGLLVFKALASLANRVFHRLGRILSLWCAGG